MEAITQLRKLARERRDRITKQAAQEYADTIKRIAAIEQDLIGQRSSTHKRISDSISLAIPKDRPFTTSDIMAGLAAIDPLRAWDVRAVSNQLGRLRRRKMIRCLRRGGVKGPGLYVREGVEVPPMPFEGLTMADAAERVLGAESMTPTEIAMAMLEAGYSTSMGKRGLLAALRVSMRRHPMRFKCGASGKWSALLS